MTAQTPETPPSNAAPMQPIGVFDSGVGGLSVVQALHRRLPGAAITYLADAGFAPYGLRSAQQLRDRSHAIARRLTDDGVATLVIACNTATAAAADDLRDHWRLPIIGMEPAIKPATRATRTGTVAVFATDGTLASQRFAGLLARHTGNTRVIIEPCGDLVAFAEAGNWEGHEVTQAARRHIDTIIAAGADTVVLGCTHFPLLMDVLREVARERVHFIDTGDAVARQIIHRTGLGSADISAPTMPLELLTTSDDSGPLTAIAERLFGVSRPARTVTLEDGHPGADIVPRSHTSA